MNDYIQDKYLEQERGKKEKIASTCQLRIYLLIMKELEYSPTGFLTRYIFNHLYPPKTQRRQKTLHCPPSDLQMARVLLG